MHYKLVLLTSILLSALLTGCGGGGNSTSSDQGGETPPSNTDNQNDNTPDPVEPVEPVEPAPPTSFNTEKYRYQAANNGVQYQYVLEGQLTIGERQLSDVTLSYSVSSQDEQYLTLMESSGEPNENWYDSQMRSSRTEWQINEGEHQYTFNHENRVYVGENGHIVGTSEHRANSQGQIGNRDPERNFVTPVSGFEDRIITLTDLPSSVEVGDSGTVLIVPDARGYTTTTTWSVAEGSSDDQAHLVFKVITENDSTGMTPFTEIKILTINSEGELISASMEGERDLDGTTVTWRFSGPVSANEGVTATAPQTEIPVEMQINRASHWYIENTGVYRATALDGSRTYYHAMSGIDMGALEALRKLNERHDQLQDIVIGVVDSGVNYNDPDFKDMMWTNDAELNGVEGVDDDNNGYVDDIYGIAPAKPEGQKGDPIPLAKEGETHGTEVASVICAKINHLSSSTAGLTPKCKLMALNHSNERGDISRSALHKIVDYMIENGVKVSNHSYARGAGFYGIEDKEDHLSLYQKLQDSGHLVITGSGNNNTDLEIHPYYPAAYDLDNIITVMGINKTGEKTTVSNWGATSVDLSAAGDWITTNTFDVVDGELVPDLDRRSSGTSFATPMVTAVAASIWSVNPDLTYQEVKAYILDNVEVIPNLTDYAEIGNSILPIERRKLNLTGGHLRYDRAIDAVISDMDSKDTGLPSNMHETLRSLSLGANITP